MAIITYPYVGTEILQEDQDDMNVIESMETGVDYTVSEDATATYNPSFFQNTHYPTESDNVSWISVSADWTRGTTNDSGEFVGKWSLYGIDDHGNEELIGVQQTTICASPTSGLETILFDLKGSGGVAPFQKISGTAPAGKVQMNLPMPYENYYAITMENQWFDSSWGKRATMSVGGGTRSNYTDPTFDFILPYLTGMNTDFSDIRFTESDGLTGCCYWIKRKVNSNYAWVTLKIGKSIKNKENKFFMYYNNASATSESSIAGVSEFYDEFDGTSYDSTKWEWYNYGTGTVAVTAGKCTIAGGTGSSSQSTLVTKTPLLVNDEGYGYIIETYAQSTTIGVSPTGTAGYLGIQDSKTSISLANNVQQVYEENTTPTAMLQKNKSGGSWGTGIVLATPSSTNTYKMVRETITYTTPYRTKFISWDGEPYGTSIKGYEYITDEPVADTIDNYYISLSARNATMEYDWISVRKYLGDDFRVSISETLSYSDYFNDNTVTFGYTSTPVSPTSGITLTETSTSSRLKLAIANGTDNRLDATNNRQATVYNAVGYYDWDYTVKMDTVTVSPGCEAGIFIKGTTGWDNVHMFSYGKSSGGTPQLQVRAIRNNVDSTLWTDSGAAAIPIYLRIERKWGYTRFKYSTNKTDWTTAYYGYNLAYSSSTPLYVGLYGTNDSNKYAYTAYFDDLELNIPEGNIITGLTSTTPDTATSDTQTIYFTTPSQWTDNNSVYFDVEEYEMDSYQTPPQPVSATNVVNLKYDNVDKYWAMRLKYEAEHDDEVSVNISKITYIYEV